MSTLMPAPPGQAPPGQAEYSPIHPSPKPDKTKTMIIIGLALALLIAAIAVIVPMMNDDPGNTVVVTAPEEPAPVEPNEPAEPAEPVGPIPAMKAAQAVIAHMPAFLGQADQREYCQLATSLGPVQSAAASEGFGPGTLGAMIQKTAAKFDVTVEAMFTEYIKICP